MLKSKESPLYPIEFPPFTSPINYAAGLNILKGTEIILLLVYRRKER